MAAQPPMALTGELGDALVAPATRSAPPLALRQAADAEGAGGGGAALPAAGAAGGGPAAPTAAYSPQQEQQFLQWRQRHLQLGQEQRQMRLRHAQEVAQLEQQLEQAPDSGLPPGWVDPETGTVYCGSCGVRLGPRANFCSNCCTKVAWPALVLAAEAAAGGAAPAGGGGGGGPAAPTAAYSPQQEQQFLTWRQRKRQLGQEQRQMRQRHAQEVAQLKQLLEQAPDSGLPPVWVDPEAGTVYCGSCGARLGPCANFCSNCCTKVAWPEGR
jgi:hypothetical protein